MSQTKTKADRAATQAATSVTPSPTFVNAAGATLVGNVLTTTLSCGMAVVNYLSADQAAPVEPKGDAQ